MSNALFQLPAFFRAYPCKVAHPATLHRGDVETEAGLSDGAAFHVLGIGAVTLEALTCHSWVAACHTDGETRAVHQPEEVFFRLTVKW